MAYINGSITDANPGPALYALLAPALTTAGYTLEDTVIISTRTHKIWKSAAANNRQALDWYLDVTYPTTGAGNLTMQPMEYFDPATNMAYRMVFGGVASTAIDATTYSRHGATGYTLEDSNLGILRANGGAPATAVTTSTSTFTYWIGVTGDRVVAMTSSNAMKVTYAGLYAPADPHKTWVGAASFPLVVGNFSDTAAGATSAASTYLGVTRLPKTTSLVGNGWATSVQIHPGIKIRETLPIFPGGATTGMGAKYMAPIMLTGDPTGVAPQALYGYLIDVGHVNATTGPQGDTVTFGSDLWVLAAYNSTTLGGTPLFKAV